ncbi:unnamed protein product [Tetraodon nigroviridis]|uniref:(spotted green pufferfish) hypothetical protein n=1 Tax=Tetraodon nigroviridis TaxID=99883 RepID=Q4RQ06_TETNG|nr:unnamed protein product [Tetraodon nigroviridis]
MDPCHAQQDINRQQAKSLGKLSTEEVCQWFTRIGLQKCLPFIREAKLCGADIVSVSLDLLHTLHISTVEDRERLLSAIYTELHPPTQLTQRLDTLLGTESPNPCDVETLAAALVSMNKSKSSSHDKPVSTVFQADSEVKASGQNSNNAAKEERIRELNQQVDSLQHAIRQIQELHHDLVAFCSELKSADGDVSADGLDSAQLRQRLELVKNRLSDKKEKAQTLRDHVNGAVTHKKKQLDVHLLEKMRLNCQVFKEEISVVHLNRQVAHLQNALQEADVKEKIQRKNSTIGSLSQLLSLESPAMLLAVQESPDSDGQYGFTCHCSEGLVVAEAANSHLCVGDRLVEVNGVPVVSATLKELEDILLQGTSAQIVVLRQPPLSLMSQQHPPDQGSDKEAVAIETTPQWNVIAI